MALVAAHLSSFRSVGTLLVRFNDWAAWPSSQRMHIFERFLASYGSHVALSEAPAFVLSKREFEDAVSFVTIGVLFLWDTHVIASKGRRIMFYSHDEIGWGTV